MVDVEVELVWIPFLDSLGFTVDTLYYGEIVLKYQLFSWRYIPGQRFIVFLIVNGDTRMLAFCLDQVQFVFWQKLAIHMIHGKSF